MIGPLTVKISGNFTLHREPALLLRKNAWFAPLKTGMALSLLFALYYLLFVP
jgi:hypothetical protein